MEPMKLFGRWIGGLGLVAAAVLLGGCLGPDTRYNPISIAGAAGSGSGMPADVSQYTIQVGDELMVSFNDVSPPINPIADQVKDDGTITLIFNETFKAAGKKVGALKDEIRKAYVPKYYKNMTVSIKIGDRFYWVSGEVRVQNKYVYGGSTTVTGAIAAAGGFTDWAKKEIEVTRGSTRFTVIYDKARRDSKEDKEIFPGDKLYVPRRVF